MLGFEIKKEETFLLVLIKDSKPTKELSDSIKEKLLVSFENEANNLVIDIQLCEELSPETLSFFLFCKRMTAEAAKSFVISNPTSEIMKFIDISNLTDQFNITPTINEAYDFIAMEEIERELGGFDELDI